MPEYIEKRSLKATRLKMEDLKDLLDVSLEGLGDVSNIDVNVFTQVRDRTTNVKGLDELKNIKILPDTLNYLTLVIVNNNDNPIDSILIEFKRNGAESTVIGNNDESVMGKLGKIINFINNKADINSFLKKYYIFISPMLEILIIFLLFTILGENRVFTILFLPIVLFLTLSGIYYAIIPYSSLIIKEKKKISESKTVGNFVLGVACSIIGGIILMIIGHCLG